MRNSFASATLAAVFLLATFFSAMAQTKTAEEWLASDGFKMFFQRPGFEFTFDINVKARRTTFYGPGTCNNGGRAIEVEAKDGKVVVLVKPPADFCEVIRYTLPPDGSAGTVEFSTDKGQTWKTSGSVVKILQ